MSVSMAADRLEQELRICLLYVNRRQTDRQKGERTIQEQHGLLKLKGQATPLTQSFNKAIPPSFSDGSTSQGPGNQHGNCAGGPTFLPFRRYRNETLGQVVFFTAHFQFDLSGWLLTPSLSAKLKMRPHCLKVKLSTFLSICSRRRRRVERFLRKLLASQPQDKGPWVNVHPGFTAIK